MLKEGCNCGSLGEALPSTGKYQDVIYELTKEAWEATSEELYNYWHLQMTLVLVGKSNWEVEMGYEK